MMQVASALFWVGKILLWVGVVGVFFVGLSVCTRIVCRAYFDERMRWLEAELLLADQHRGSRK